MKYCGNNSFKFIEYFQVKKWNFDWNKKGLHHNWNKFAHATIFNFK